MEWDITEKLSSTATDSGFSRLAVSCLLKRNACLLAFSSRDESWEVRLVSCSIKAMGVSTLDIVCYGVLSEI